MKQRSVYIPDDLWMKVRLRAVAEGVAASDLVTKVLAEAFPEETVARSKTVADLATVEERR